MGGGGPRPLEPEEKALLDQMRESGASETEIAKQLAELSRRNVEKGYGYLDATEAKNAALESVLQSIMEGKQSFVDDELAGRIYGQARENAANEFKDADRVLADKFARRGLFGGGQHASALKDVELEKARTLAEQGTQIYADQAQRKAIERASALDSLIQTMTGSRAAGLSLTGMGGGNLGQSANAFQGVGSNLAGTFNAMTSRPNQPSVWDRIFGAAQAGAGFIPFFKR